MIWLCPFDGKEYEYQRYEDLPLEIYDEKGWVYKRQPSADATMIYFDEPYTIEAIKEEEKRKKKAIAMFEKNKAQKTIEDRINALYNAFESRIAKLEEK